MERPDTDLDEYVLTLVDLGEGCAVGGILMEGGAVWLAWGPFGIMPRVFPSKWKAIGAVSFAMRAEWSRIGRRELAELDDADLSALERAVMRVVATDDDDGYSRLWSVKVGKTQRFLVEETGERLLPSSFHSIDDARVARQAVVDRVKPAVAPSPLGR